MSTYSEGNDNFKAAVEKADAYQAECQKTAERAAAENTAAQDLVAALKTSIQASEESSTEEKIEHATGEILPCFLERLKFCKCTGWWTDRERAAC